jgi:hypothetical protein
VLVALAFVGLSACDSDNEIFVPVRITHTVANAPGVDALNHRGTIVAGLDFKQATESSSVGCSANTISVNANLPGGDQLTLIAPATLAIA